MTVSGLVNIIIPVVVQGFSRFVGAFSLIVFDGYQVLSFVSEGKEADSYVYAL